MTVRLFIPAAVIGAILGLAIGYVAFKASGGLGDFIYWFQKGMDFERFSYPRDALFWMVGGVVVAVAVTLMCKKNSN